MLPLSICILFMCMRMPALCINELEAGGEVDKFISRKQREGHERAASRGQKGKFGATKERKKSRLFDAWTDSIMFCKKREPCASVDSLNHQTQLIIVEEAQKAANGGRLGCIVSGRLANVFVKRKKTQQGPLSRTTDT